MNQERMESLKHGVRSILNLALAGGRGKVDYLPAEMTAEEIRAFEPHEWVVNAVTLALFSGSFKGRTDPVAYFADEKSLLALGLVIGSGGNVSDIVGK